MAISGETVFVDNILTVLTSTKTDSHREIRQEHGIREDDGGLGGRLHTPVELVPTTSLTEIGGMEFSFDAGRPDWWEDWMTEEATRQLFAAWMLRWKNEKTLVFPDDLNLYNLKTISKRVTIRAGRDLNLRDVETISEGVTLISGRCLDLRHLRTIPGGVTIEAGGYLDLRSVRTILERVTIKSEECLDLKSIKTILEEVTIVAKKRFDFGSVKTTYRE